MWIAKVHEGIFRGFDKCARYLDPVMGLQVATRVSVQWSTCADNRQSSLYQ